MKKSLSVLLVACFCSSVSAQLPPDAAIQKLGEAFLREKDAVGLSIGVLHNGKQSFYNFGTTNMIDGHLPTANTVYEIGSVTKTFVSLLLANAVLEKKMALSDDIRKYLVEPYPNLAYNGEPIRLLHLANTTSLLPDWLPGLPPGIDTLSADAALALKIKYYKGFGSKDFFKALHSVKLDTVPGTKARHSNAGAQLLAYLLERVYQTPVDKLIARYISNPFGMTRTSFAARKKNKEVATGYMANGSVAGYEAVMPYFQYAGGLRSSAHDMLQYLQVFLDASDKAAILSQEKTVDIDAVSGRITTLRPAGAAAPDVYSICLNWLKYQPEANSSQVWADGGTNGFNSYVVFYPHQKAGIVLLANKSSEKIFHGLPGMAYEISKVIDKK